MNLAAVPPPPPDDPPEGQPTIAVALELTITAIAPPDSDAVVVALARKMASAIDGMKGDQLALMIGQTAPQFLKVLQELEGRAAVRRKARQAAKPSGVSKLRASHAQTVAKRQRGGA